MTSILMKKKLNFLLGDYMKLKTFLYTAFILFSFSAFLQAQTWSARKQLTYTGGGSIDPAIAADTIESVHVTWERESATGTDIYYKSSLAWGDSWAAPERICWSTGQSSHPDIAADSTGRKHIFWHDYTPPGVENSEIFYKHSAHLAPWSPLIRVTWTSEASAFPAAATDSNNNVHLVWMDWTPGNWEIFYKNTTDMGTTWSTATRLSWDSESSAYPAINIDSSDNIHIIWQNHKANTYRIHYKRSTDGGSTFSAVTRLTLPSWDCWYPDVATDSNGYVHIVYANHETTNNEVYYKKSTDGGETWSAPTRITYNSGYSSRPEIAVDTSDNLHLVWEDSTFGNAEIFYKESTDGGNTWSPIYRLTWDSNFSGYPVIDTDQFDYVHVVWRNTTVHDAAWEIFYKNRK